MSVLIKDMEMPTECHGCRWFYFQGTSCAEPKYYLDARCEMVESGQDWYGKDARGGWIGESIEHIPGWSGNYSHQHCVEMGTRASQCPLCELPSAQPERTQERAETHACDLIDREAAADAIYHHLPSVSRTRARTMLHEVPSAQPDVPDINVGDMISRDAAMEMLMNQNVIMDGSEYHNGFNAGVNRAQEVIRNLPTVQSNVPVINVGDMISRQAATTIPVMPKEHRHYQTNNLDDAYEQGWTDLQECIENLPPVQPKHGRWIERNPLNSDKCRLIECDQCGKSYIVGFNVPYEHWIENKNYCEKCGADMRGGVDG